VTATLRITDGPAQGKTLELDGEIVIGRENADLTIADPELSRRHAAVRPDGEAVEIEDLGSLNGTFVDGKRIEGPARLESEATIKMGTSLIAVEFPPPPSDATVARPIVDEPTPAPDMTAPRRIQAVPEPDVTAPRQIREQPPEQQPPEPQPPEPPPEPDVTAPRQIREQPPEQPPPEPDVTAPRQIREQPPEPDVTAPRQIREQPPEPDVTAPRQIREQPPAQPDVTAPRQVAQKAGPQPALIAAGVIIAVLIAIIIVLLLS
jgi:predicted component of type VI protein secretion system